MKTERFVIVKSPGYLETYYQRRTRDGRPVGTLSLRLARKWENHSEAFRFLQALVNSPPWRTAYVGTA
jgi:hypothetical protein